MTRAEQAAFRRLEKRHALLRMVLVVIRTWLYKSTANWADTETLCQWIKTLAVDALAADEAAEHKEQEKQRHD